MTVTRFSTTLFAAALVMTSVASTAGTLSHKVRQGDTLWDLAAKHHLSAKQIARANGISETSTLKLGKLIRIPSKESTKHNSSNKVARNRTERNQRRAERIARKHAIQTTASSAVTSESPTLIRTALACRGSAYRRGGVNRSGFDCSGFTRYVFAKYGIALPHSSAAQASLGTPISRSEVKAGDLVFFQTNRRGISHVGISIGNGQFVHAATYGRGVRIDALNGAYYSGRYRCARRVK